MGVIILSKGSIESEIVNEGEMAIGVGNDGIIKKKEGETIIPLENTGSFNNFTSSYYSDSQSFDTRINNITGSSSPNITDIQYASLIVLRNTDSLVDGQMYRMTDYQTIYLMPFTNEIHSGSIESLIITAISTSSLNKVAYSELYPQDIIYYDIDDNNCEDGTFDNVTLYYTGGTPRPGKITYRKDTKYNLETHYDWRNVKFRRWAIDAQTWISGNLYYGFDVVKDPTDSKLYVCLFNTTSSIEPNANIRDWQLWLDVTITPFWLYTWDLDNDFDMSVSPDNLIVSNSIPGVDYQDYYTFALTDDLNNPSGVITSGGGIIGSGYKNFSIGKNFLIYDEYLSENIYIPYNNTVFYLTPNNYSEDRFQHVEIKCNNYHNTIGMIGNYSRVETNVIGEKFTRNIFASNDDNCCFVVNTIGDFCRSNIILYFADNLIGNYFAYNYAKIWSGNTTQHNVNSTVCTYVLNNNINGFMMNVKSYYLDSNTFLGTNNSIYQSGSSEDVECYCMQNMFGYKCGDMFFQEEFRYNVLGTDSRIIAGPTCSYNVVGPNCLIRAGRELISNTFESNYIRQDNLPSVWSVTFGDGVKLNTFKPECFRLTESLDLTSATHLSNDYNCTIYRVSGSIVPRLKYYDLNDTPVYVNVTD